MKHLFCIVAALGATVALANDLTPYITSADKIRMEQEAQVSPLIGAEWKAHSMGAADYSVTNRYEYDGTAKTPTPAVKLNGTALTAGTDFTFSYTNNVKAGWASCKVTAAKLGYYGGQAVNFYIAPKPLTSAMVSNVTAQVYTGQPVTPVPVVTDGATALVNGTDFTCRYADNVRTTTNATVFVTGLGNYTGTITKHFTIAEED